MSWDCYDCAYRDEWKEREFGAAEDHVRCKLELQQVHVQHCSNWRKTTNADLIRRMSDEEMAKILADNDGCPPGFSLMPCNGMECSACWLDWLKREVEP